jgi:phospholipase/carboxylesterase
MFEGAFAYSPGMQAKLMEGGPLTYLLIRPDEYDPARTYPLIVLLHGFGANMYDLAGLSPAIDPTGYIYACPNAPYQLDIGGQTGFSWSLGRPGMPDLTEQGPTVEERLSGFFDEVTREAGTGPGRVLLCGFSQGGGLTLRFGLPRPDAFAGLVVLSGAFRGDEAFREALPPRRDVPIFIAHGLYDPMVTVQRGQETLAFLEGAGYQPEYHEYEMAHEISEEVIYDLQPWVRRVLPP